MRIAPFDTSASVNTRTWRVKLHDYLGCRGRAGAIPSEKLKRSLPVYRQAAILLFYMLRNSSLAIVGAWLVNYLFSRGNVFSGVRPDKQSLASFTAACMGWMSVITTLGVVCVLGASFMPLHFVWNPSQQPTWWRCIGLLLKRTHRWFIFSVSSTIGTSYAFGLCSARVKKWKLHFYVGGALITVFTTRALQASRRMYLLETLEGRARGVADPGTYYRRIRATYLANMQLLVSVYVAAAYVHGSSQLNLRTNVELVAFGAISLVVKLVAQEAAMRSVMRQARSQVNRMYISVAIPTVLIDTQVRILLLNATTTIAAQTSYHQIQVWGSALLAFAEVAVRVWKVWWLRVKIGQRRRDYESRRANISIPSRTFPQPDHEISQDTQESGAVPPKDADSMFEVWRKRRLCFHAAEVQADMYAEYIAIGCSLSIYHFYHGHPKYILSQGHITAPEQSFFSTSYIRVVLFQVILEIGIDFACSLVEISAGVPWKVPRGSGAFVAAVFIFGAVGNIAVSSAMYLVNTDGN